MRNKSFLVFQMNINKKMIINPPSYGKKTVAGRSCHGCTKCCDGYLNASVLGHELGSGVGCPYVRKSKGCSIYELRPTVCSGFKCEWLTNPALPDSFKPSESNAIFKRNVDGGKEYLFVIKAGKPFSEELIKQVEQLVEEGKIERVEFERGDGNYWIFSKDQEWKDDRFDLAIQELKKSREARETKTSLLKAVSPLFK
jgi:hypothetical protein